MGKARLNNAERPGMRHVRPILRGARSVALEASPPLMMAGALAAVATSRPIECAALGAGSVGIEVVNRIFKRKGQKS